MVSISHIDFDLKLMTMRPGSRWWWWWWSDAKYFFFLRTKTKTAVSEREKQIAYLFEFNCNLHSWMGIWEGRTCIYVSTEMCFLSLARMSPPTTIIITDTPFHMEWKERSERKRKTLLCLKTLILNDSSSICFALPQVLSFVFPIYIIFVYIRKCICGICNVNTWRWHHKLGLDNNA